MNNLIIDIIIWDSNVVRIVKEPPMKRKKKSKFQIKS